MLVSLAIDNYALIEQLRVDFSNKFSVITGETGAGKSILLGALGLVMGNRADLSALKNQDAKCIVEATFAIEKYNLKSIFNDLDLDYESQTIIRREILSSGKSRAFVNDTPVNLNVLARLSEFLIDIHSQHQTKEVLSRDYQTYLLDAASNNFSFLGDYKKQLKQLSSAKKELTLFISKKELLEKEAAYNQHLFTELEALQLPSLDIEDLESQLETLSNVSFIKEQLALVVGKGQEENIGIESGLLESKNALQKIAAFKENFKSLNERLQSIIIEYTDVLNESESAIDSLEDNPNLAQSISDTLEQVYTLQKKHQVADVAGLIAVYNDLDSKLVEFGDIDTTISKKEKEVEMLTKACLTLAQTISENRKKAAPDFEKDIEKLLHLLGMPDARFTFDFTEVTDFTANGTDAIDILFSANKGMQLGQLKKTASGGEMSRIMLAIKAILSKYSALPSLILDEIDTGVSGEVALKMGQIMKRMSEKMQLFAITHLPQIASQGDQHYKVFKYNEGDTTRSSLKLLNHDERILEIAEMLSGKNITDSAKENAKDLLR